MAAVALRMVFLSFDNGTFDLNNPIATVAFLPSMAIISPTELLPSTVTVSPTESGSSALICGEEEALSLFL